MKLYKVTSDQFVYDTYDGFIVSANNPEEALETIKKFIDPDNMCDDNFFSTFDFETAKVVEIIKSEKPEIILASFNAG